MLCQTSTQEARKTESNNNIVRKGDSSIMHVGYTILAAAVEAGIDEIGAFSTTSRHATHLSTENTSQILEMLLMDNIHVSIVTQELHIPKILAISRDILILCDITPRE